MTKKQNMKTSYPISKEIIESKILVIRNQKVMLDCDLAMLYGVETRVLIQAVKRNIDRFPGDFMFRLNECEFGNLKSHFVISSQHGGRRYLPYAFTEHGILMLSSILKSKRAINVNIQIMRTFVALRKLLRDNFELSQRLEQMEKKYDNRFKIIFDAIRMLIKEKETKNKPKDIGFKPKK